MSVAFADTAADEEDHPRLRADAFILKCAIVALLISCSVFKLHFSLGHSRAHVSVLYLDLPILCAMTLISALYRFSDPKPLNVRTGMFFPLFPLIAWWFASGMLHAHKPDFFAASILQFFSGALVLLALPRLLVRHRLVEFCMEAFLACSVVVSLGAFVQVLMNPKEAFGNVTSILNPNHAHLGLYMLLALTVAMYRASFKRRTGWYLLVAALAFVSILLSGSRAALLGCALVLAAYFLRRLTLGNLLKLIAGGILIGSLFLYIVEQREQGAGAQKTEEFQVSENVSVDKSAGRRLLMWAIAWKVIHSSDANYWRGIGFTNFRWDYDKETKLPFFTTAAHNVYLTVWAETGLIGLILYLWVFASLMIYAIRRSGRDRTLLLFIGMMAGVYFTGLTQETLFPNEAQSNFNVLYFFVCLLIVLDHQARFPQPSGAIAGPKT